MDITEAENNGSGEEETILSLPMKKKDLGNFISSLLGQQQSIERDFEIDFNIDHDWLLNLNDLLHQRITQQADSTLVSFNAIIYFENNTKRRITSVDAFRSYFETKKFVSVGIGIGWNYLVQFPSKPFPEKQEISFSAHIYTKKSRGNNVNSSLYRLIGDSERSYLSFNIEHTERTWGDDLEVILSKEVEDITRTKLVPNSYYDSIRVLGIMLVTIVIIIFPVVQHSYDQAYSLKSLVNTYENIDKTDQVDVAQLDLKIDSLFEVLVLQKQEGFIKIGSIGTLLLSPFIMLLLLYMTRRKSTSFLLLSDESKRQKDINIKKESRSKYIAIFTYGMAVIASVIANFGYSWLIGG